MGKNAQWFERADGAGPVVMFRAVEGYGSVTVDQDEVEQVFEALSTLNNPKIVRVIVEMQDD